MHHLQRVHQFRTFVLNGVDPVVASDIVCHLYSLQPRNLDSDLVKVRSHLKGMVQSFRQASVGDNSCWYRPEWLYWNTVTSKLDSVATCDADSDESWAQHKSVWLVKRQRTTR